MLSETSTGLAAFIYDRTYKIIQFAGMKLPITAIQVERHSVNTIINTYMYIYIYVCVRACARVRVSVCARVRVSVCV